MCLLALSICLFSLTYVPFGVIFDVLEFLFFRFVYLVLSKTSRNSSLNGLPPNGLFILSQVSDLLRSKLVLYNPS